MNRTQLNRFSKKITISLQKVQINGTVDIIYLSIIRTIRNLYQHIRYRHLINEIVFSFPSSALCDSVGLPTAVNYIKKSNSGIKARYTHEQITRRDTSLQHELLPEAPTPPFKQSPGAL